MNIDNAVVLITGANRGLGLALATVLQRAGARKIYAAARDPASITQQGVVPLKLDVANAGDVEAAVAACGDVTLLINNAGISLGSPILAAGSVAALRAELEINLFGPMLLSKGFAPVLARNGGGAIVNIISVLSWLSFPGAATYSTSKSAAWALTNGLRNELHAQGTQVLAAHMGFMDTDMTAGLTAEKAAPLTIAEKIVAALVAGQEEVLADAMTEQVKQGFSAPRGIYMGSPLESPMGSPMATPLGAPD